ncbi:MAG: ATP-binding protein [Calditrichia bacterium]
MLIIQLVRQKPKLPIIALYSYIVFLLTLEGLGALYVSNSTYVDGNLLIEKSRLILQCFILAILYYFSNSFTYSRTLSGLTVGKAAVFLAALIPVVLVLDNTIIVGLKNSGYGHTAEYSKYFWVFITLFCCVSGLLFMELHYKSRRVRTSSESLLIAPLYRVIYPLGIATLIVLYVFPYFWGFNPLFLAGYVIISVTLYFSARRFQILEIEEDTRYLLPIILLISLFLLFFFLSPETPGLKVILWSIPIFISAVWIGHSLLVFFIKASENTLLGYNELLDRKLEDFSRQLIRFIDLEALLEYVANFCRDTFKTPRVAILTTQYDVSPYQIAYLAGFQSQAIEALVNTPNSKLLEQLEVEQKILNKFDYENDSVLFTQLDNAGIYLGIPLIKQDNLIGLIFLGGERRFIPIPQRYLHILRLLSAQLAIAIANLQSIQQALQSEKMAGIGMLSSQIAHDFRSFVSLVKLHTRDSDNERLARNALHVEKLVKDLLNYTRPQPLQKKPVDINQLVDMSLDLLTIPEDIRIEKNYADELPKIPLDMHQMRRVFSNIIENGTRAMRDSEGKTMRISTRPLHPTSKVSSDLWISIDIEDAGDGIDEQHLNRIFDPFFTTFKREGGTGLGLSIVQQIIRMHSGYVTIDSKRNHGTTVQIRLPYQAV